MKYLCLVYLEEDKLHADARPRVPGRQPCRCARPRATCIAAEPLHPARHRDDAAPARRRADDDRRPVRRDEGAARRLLSRSTPATSTKPSGSPARSRRCAAGSIEVRPVRALDPEPLSEASRGDEPDVRARRRPRRASPSATRPGAGPCGRACRRRARAPQPRSTSSRALPPRPLPSMRSAVANTATLTTASFGSRSTSVRPRPPLPCSFSSSSPNTSRRPASVRQATRAAPAPTIAGGSGFSSPSRARKALPPRWRATRSAARASRPKPPVPASSSTCVGRAGEVVRRLRAGLEVDQRRDRLAVAAPARQAARPPPNRRGRCCRRRAACRRCGSEGAVERVAGLERRAAPARPRGPSARAPSPSC